MDLGGLFFKVTVARLALRVPATGCWAKRSGEGDVDETILPARGDNGIFQNTASSGTSSPESSSHSFSICSIVLRGACCHDGTRDDVRMGGRGGRLLMLVPRFGDVKARVLGGRVSVGRERGERGAGEELRGDELTATRFGDFELRLRDVLTGSLRKLLGSLEVVADLFFTGLECPGAECRVGKCGRWATRSRVFFEVGTADGGIDKVLTVRI